METCAITRGGNVPGVAPTLPALTVKDRRDLGYGLALVWGVHPVQIDPPTVDTDVPHVISEACRIAVSKGIAHNDEALAIGAGMPFGTAGSTNLLHLARITDESTVTGDPV